MSRKLIFFSPFNTAKFTCKSKYSEWNRYRFDLCKKYTMNSILRQINPNWEYWLGCSPETQSIMESFKSELPDPRIKILYYLYQFKEEIAKIPQFDNILYARIDSDDMFAPDVTDILLNEPISAKYFQFNTGFAYCNYSKRLYHWKQDSSPFYTSITKQGEGWPGIPSHGKIRGRSSVLAVNKFCVLIHGRNTSTTLNAAPIGKEIKEPSRSTILHGFGIS
jgi:hypothetical protein